ncbi:hypothetical protein MF672_034965 [Actinomadura sp. ATCC 31491]|uniref:Uncharacterized protein n=1 Tax=Actinomadura luzonensis TaxID=2805427 RepID=A0ABT0G2W3_9ACTN|nr:hypothetical protein [Actinomadura luzonensis]MCK2218960.1 hypothetical protein [Actinomadura luzonensis]
MGRIAVLGESARVLDFGLAGAVVVPADTPEAVRLAWATLPSEVLVVILTPMAARALGPVRNPLTVVMAERTSRP